MYLYFLFCKMHLYNMVQTHSDLVFGEILRAGHSQNQKKVCLLQNYVLKSFKLFKNFTNMLDILNR